ncbi:hypothetical protein CVT24_010299 [Panaeolus cyanescens]|uniref:NAD(P)-binding protein n=1 Tax=Panaeolus cyanescens TaxID=181874 RepID=A0A409YQD3_9AGAR|nr:hypothetical protein CVT24_010299 [Panaeolus cyanescens]
MGKGGSNNSMNPAEVMGMTTLVARQVPTLSYTLQNVVISMASIAVSTLSFCFTCFVVLPLAVGKLIFGPFISAMDLGMKSSKENKNMDGNIDGMPAGYEGSRMKPIDERKVVLVVGASGGIGLCVVKQYMNDSNVLIIAASDKIGTSFFFCAEVDLGHHKKQLSESLRALDKQYGPITHLYEVGAVLNNHKHMPYNLDVAAEMININVAGTTTAVLTMFELMKPRGYGKICIVGSIVGSINPANQISYAATKAYINSFTSSLRVLAAPSGVDVVNVQPCFIDTRMAQNMRAHGTTVPGWDFADPEGMAKVMMRAVEGGGVGVVMWPGRQAAVMYALRALNPIMDEVAKWTAMKAGIAGKKVT